MAENHSEKVLKIPFAGKKVVAISPKEILPTRNKHSVTSHTRKVLGTSLLGKGTDGGRVAKAISQKGILRTGKTNRSRKVSVTSLSGKGTGDGGRVVKVISPKEVLPTGKTNRSLNGNSATNRSRKISVKNLLRKGTGDMGRVVKENSVINLSEKKLLRRKKAVNVISATNLTRKVLAIAKVRATNHFFQKRINLTANGIRPANRENLFGKISTTRIQLMR